MNHFKIKILSLILVFVLTIPVCASSPYSENPRVLTRPSWNPDVNISFPESEDAELNAPKESDMGKVRSYDKSLNKFTNYVDGYSLLIPKDMNVDLSVSDVGTTFSNDTLTFRVFKEDFSTNEEMLSYLSYSNKFIDNTIDHTKEFQTSYSVDNIDYHILQWSRRELKGIPNDKNYYSCVDVCVGTDVYTFFFTSSEPYIDYNSYMIYPESLTFFTPSVKEDKAYNKGYRGTDISGLNDSAKDMYEKLFADDTEFKLGIFPAEKDTGLDKMERIEKEIGYNFCAFLLYTEFTDRNGMSLKEYEPVVNKYISKIETNFKYAAKSGKALELTLQTPLSRKNSSANMIYEILDGDYDLFIDIYAEMIAKYPEVTVLFRPFNEMNGDWCNYSAYHLSRDPQLYVELYKHLYKSFKDAGCDNVIWVWNPNERSFPNYKWNNESLYYPGDEYVDVYGITGYNTGNYYNGEIWRSFDEIYEPIYERVLKLNDKPVMITEFACSAIGGDKIKWIEDMFRVLPKYNKIKVGIWWDATDWDGNVMSRPYYIDSPNGTLNVFKKYLN